MNINSAIPPRKMCTLGVYSILLVFTSHRTDLVKISRMIARPQPGGVNVNMITRVE